MTAFQQRQLKKFKVCAGLGCQNEYEWMNCFRIRYFSRISSPRVHFTLCSGTVDVRDDFGFP